jgi:hypothetical protein
MGTQKMQVSFNTDRKGFISHECPACERRFKVQPGKGSPKPVSHCPFCTHTGTNCWFTTEQASYLRGIAARDVLGPHLADIDRAFQRLGSSSGGMIKVKVTGRREEPRVPPKPEERDDEMTGQVTFACCGETIRHEVANPPTYCTICGSRTPGTS